VKLQRVRVLGHHCGDCFVALKADCAAAGHPHVGRFAVAPSSWLSAVCPYRREGVWLEAIGGPSIDDDEQCDDPSVAAASENVGADRDKSRWQELWPDKNDATKGAGYPAREEGRYGSYPQYDSSDE